MLEINKALGEGIREIPKGIFDKTLAGKVDRTFDGLFEENEKTEVTPSFLKDRK